MADSGKADEKFTRWAQAGWLASDAYNAFWGGVLAGELRPFLQGKSVADIGAGKARIWSGAFAKGLSLQRLELVDPHLDIEPALAARAEVHAVRQHLEQVWPALDAEVVFFKQSFHFAYAALGAAVFSRGMLINLSMPSQPLWPVSPAFMDLYRPTVLDVVALARASGKEPLFHSTFRFPVRMPRSEWVGMLKNRFVSCLHACDEHIIEAEVEWAQSHLPDSLEFEDALECVVFA